MNQKKLENTILLKNESKVNQNFLYLCVAQNHSSVYCVNCMHSSEVTDQCIKVNKDKLTLQGQEVSVGGINFYFRERPKHPTLR